MNNLIKILIFIKDRITAFILLLAGAVEIFSDVLDEVVPKAYVWPIRFCMMAVLVLSGAKPRAIKRIVTRKSAKKNVT